MGDKTYPLDDNYSKEQTVRVNVGSTKLISPEPVIDEIEKKCGVGSVLACVPKNDTGYEVVMRERRNVGEISGDSISIQGKSCSVNELISVFRIVSIFSMSMYVTDEEIIDRFDRMGVEIVTDIRKRKMSTRSNVYDDTRVFKVKLPPTLASIPYSMKFTVSGKDTAYYRVIHNDQVKVCSGCYSAEHLYRDCPEFKCFKCGQQGHISKNCSENKFNGEDGNGEDADDGNGNGNDDDGNGEIGDDNEGDGIGNGDEDDEDEYTDADEAMEDDVTEIVDNASDNGEKTKIATDNKRIKRDKTIWDGDIFYCNSGNNRQGVAILVSKKLKNIFLEVENDNGRFIHIKGKINDKLIDIYNIYAPNNVNERYEFFLKCKQKISKGKYVLVAGDFNTTLSSLDKSGKTLHCNDKAVKSLCNFMQEKGLYDIWRNRNVNTKVFSRKQVVQGFLTQSRIDYFLVSLDLKSCIKNIHYKDTSFSDHSIVSMKVDFCNVERGPGVWIFNNSFLQDELFTDKMKRLFAEEIGSDFYVSNPLIWWDNLKFTIKRLSQIYGKEKQKDLNREYYKLQNKNSRIIKLKTQLEDIETYKCKGAILRSKSQWALESDRNTAYFLKLEKYRQNKNVISEIKDCGGKIVTETNDLLDVIHDYYIHLFSCVSIDMHSVDELLNNVNVKIDDEDVEMCDNEINIEEIEKSLKGMKKGKTPGPDGKDISDTVASVRDFMDLVEMDDIECYLLKLDQEKAFDRAGHEYLFAVLDKFGFAEPLSIAIKKNCEIRGVVIPNTNVEEKVFVHADDTTLTLVDKNSVSETFRVLELYEKASGAKLNKEKSEVLVLGKGKICSNDLKIWKIKECDEVLQLLGIWVGKNKTLCENLNWEGKKISIPRTIDISIICKNVHYDLKLCSTKTLYTIMLENIVEEPVGIELWKSEFDVSSEAFSKIWEHVNMYWKPSNLVELDFKVLHNCIFTNVKLQKIGLVDDNICKVCCSEKENILHIFMNCDKLEDFHNYLSSLLVRIFENCDSEKISLVRSEELLILGLRWHMKEQTVTVNVVNTNLIKPESVIDEIERRCGTGSVLACVPKFGTSYEVVMQERRYVGEISGDHLSLQGKTCPVNELISVFKIVSIINLSMFDRNPGKRKSHWLGNPNVEHSEEDKKCKVSDQSENDKVDDMKDKGNNSEPSQTVQSPVEDTSLITTEALVIQKQQMCDDVESNDGNNGEDDVNDGNNGDDDDGDTDVDDVMNGNVSATVAKSENGVQIKNANAKTDEDCEQIYEELELTVSKCNDLLVINENVVTSEGILSENCNIDEDVSIISSLEQTCSQGEDEGAYGELEEIDMDTVSLTDKSQGEGVDKQMSKSKLQRVKKKERRNKMKIKPNVKAAMIAHKKNDKTKK
ncbi:unnamed protein product [Mytilus coruscus]|uniref:CCHC-type domain-containing protein n=1 Tax=Mytilus coruscus TaxID=42192 RepID=A0A6J8CJ62_MYTCO|nr:unnamed protein product [Mytilus coruscus]